MPEQVTAIVAIPDVCATSPDAQTAPLATSASITPEQAQAAAQGIVFRDAENEALKAQAVKELAATVRHYSLGSKQSGAQWIVAGEHCRNYVAIRMRLGEKREQAVKIAEGRLAEQCLVNVDANELIRASVAFNLFTIGMERKAALVSIPYEHLRRGYSRMIERNKATDGAETYCLLTGMESACRAVFVKAQTSKLSYPALADEVTTVLKDYAKLQAEQSKAAARLKEEKAAQERDALRKASEERKAQELKAAELKAAQEKAAQELKAAQQNDSALTEQEKTQAIETAQTLDNASKAAREALDKAQKAESEANDRAIQAERERVKAAQDAESKAKNAKREEDKAQGVKPVKAQKTAVASQGASIIGTLASMAKQGSAKDTADMLANCIMSANDPMALVAELFNVLALRFQEAKDCHANMVLTACLTSAVHCPELSATAQRAARAGLNVLAKREPAQVDVDVKEVA